MAQSVVELLQQRLVADPARPLVTVVADEGRVELSALTLGNWVAKTAGLLAHDLYVADNSIIDVDLPLSWQAIAWQHAIWRAGYVLGMGSGRGSVVVLDEHASAAQVAAAEATGADVIRVGRHLLGLAPAGAVGSTIDWATAARAMPDRFAAPLPLAAATALTRESTTLTHDELLTYATDLAARWQVGSGTRCLVDARHQPVDAWLGSALVPVVTEGSIVVWTAEREPTGADLEAEGVTAVAR